jgi:soluble lytic murein transglycosylase-like protein
MIIKLRYLLIIPILATLSVAVFNNKCHQIEVIQELPEFSKKHSWTSFDNAEILAERVGKVFNKIPSEEIRLIVNSAIKHESKEGEFPSRYDILAVIAVESGFNCKAKNGKDSGCMQINRGHWPSFPEEAFWDIDENIRYGAYLLENYFQKNNGDTNVALKIYNSGETAVRNNREKPGYSEKFNRYKNELFYSEM